MDFGLTTFINILNLVFSIVILFVVIKLSYVVMKLPLKNDRKNDEQKNRDK